MTSRTKIYSLPHTLTRSDTAARAFSSLPADERQAFAESFSARQRGANGTEAAEIPAFMQNTQNPDGILY